MKVNSIILFFVASAIAAPLTSIDNSEERSQSVTGDVKQCRAYCGDKAREFRDDCLRGLEKCSGSECNGFRQNCLTNGERFFLSCEKGCFLSVQNSN